jgi:lipoate-protein ligase A
LILKAQRFIFRIEGAFKPPVFMEPFRPLKSENSDFLPEEPLGETVLNLEVDPVRVWRPKSTVVVLGRSQKAENEIHLENTKQDLVPVFQRFGGGGCVVLDENCICIALRYDRRDSLNISDFLGHSSKGIQLFLKETYELDVEIQKNYDLLLDDRKFLGCSLYMPRGMCIYYAVLMLDAPVLDKIDRYLKFPSKVPEHRLSRNHRDFLIPLRAKIDCTYESFEHDLREFFVQTKWTSF